MSYFSIAIFWIMIQIFIQTLLVWCPKSKNLSRSCLFFIQPPLKYLNMESIISFQLNENWISTNDLWNPRYTVSIFRASLNRTDHQTNGILYIYTVESYSSQRLLVERVCSKLKEPFHVRFNQKSWHETSDVGGGSGAGGCARETRHQLIRPSHLIMRTATSTRRGSQISL